MISSEGFKMTSFLDKLKILGRPGEDDYTEVDLGQFEEISGSPEKMLRFAELSKADVLPEIKQEIYAGNIVLVDISGLKHDKAALDRAIGELKKAVDDVSGDIAGIGDDLVAMVPHGIRIDREKVVGGRD
jgi:hypothetical protein